VNHFFLKSRCGIDRILKKPGGGAMAVKIIIDRKVKRGKESDFAKLIRELRGKAISSKGYVSGETLRALEDPNNYIVISTWQSVEDWINWEKNPQRKKIHTKIEKLMARPSESRIYVNA
jgi:heme-degrading monooxygenase HmoA